ncbi:unnamed protein product [Trifolium pratense]|uniref:Uncharacterized protein n=1 Tax=Trifolium pratense TaxID=57577 RepID=A0ACB0JC66_TRIPR|nr:unnamed protein product [Trifolium pratense]
MPNFVCRRQPVVTSLYTRRTTQNWLVMRWLVTTQNKGSCSKIAIQVEGPQNVNEESLILQRIAKGRTKLEKLKQENREKELELLMFKALRNNASQLDC